MKRAASKPNWPFTLNRDCAQASRLVGWWPGGPNGAVLYDRSLSGNKGLLSGFPAPLTRASGWYEGKGGGKGAVVFDGSNDAITFTAAQSLTYYFAPTQPFSFSMWLFPGTIVGVVGFLCGVRATPGGPDGPGWFCYYVKATEDVAWAYYGANLQINQRESTAASVPSGKWTHITCTRDSANNMAGTKIYINGKLDAGTATDTGTPTDPSYGVTLFGIGFNPQLTNFPYLGAIEDLKIWNRVLSANEVYTYFRDPWALRYQPSRTAKLFNQGGSAPAFNVPPLNQVSQPHQPRHKVVAY
jgi:hypothetical protein